MTKGAQLSVAGMWVYAGLSFISSRKCDADNGWCFSVFTIMLMSVSGWSVGVFFV